MAENPSQREETDRERLDRQLNQLLNELRVAMPGVQVLFAFLRRLMFQARDKPRLVALSSTFALGGLLALAIAINGALLLVTDVLFDGTAVIVTTIAAATLYIGLWFVLGLVRRISKDGS